ncbi:EpsG family protein [Vibrio owensii]|uniref:EpsG family protein n=1 Tax=Vibrio owensii TaxID=696485 RepID=UPI0018F2137F|nr:EpsG family protein [Vibrio owensii]
MMANVNMKVNVTSLSYGIIASLLLLISNFFAFLFIAFNLKKVPLFFIAIFFSVLAYFFVPPESYDLYRHQQFYDQFRYKSSVEVFAYTRDLYLIFSTALGNYLNLSSGFLSFISCFILYYYPLKIVNIERHKFYLNKYQIYTYVLLCVFLFPVIFYSGIRFPVGLSIFIYGLYCSSHGRYKIAYIYMLLAALCHMSFWVVFIFFLVAKTLGGMPFQNRLGWGGVIFLFFVLGVNVKLIVNSITPLFDVINSYFGYKFIVYETYLSGGEYGFDATEGKSPLFVFSHYIHQTLFLLLCTLYVSSLKKWTPISFLTLTMICLCMVGINLQTVFERYSYVVIFSILISNISNRLFMKGNALLNAIVGVLCLVALLTTFTSFVMHSSYLLASYTKFYQISVLGMMIE